MKGMEWAKQAPVIRLNEIVRRLGNAGYARLAAHRMIKGGVLKKVARGAYSASEDVFAVASNIHYPSYVSFLAASYRNGLTEAIPQIITVATRKRHKPLEFRGYGIEFIPLRHVWGYHKEGDGRNVAFIADVEKLMIDAFLHPAAMGNFSEIANVFENSGQVDAGRMREYLRRAGANKLYRQVGYMLERHKGLDLHGLLPMDRNYYNLNPFGKAGRKALDRKWRLWV